MIDLYYADTMGGKTTAIEQMAHFFYEKYGKKTRVWIGDGGEATYNRRGGVDDGWIQLMDISRYDYPMATLKMIADGFFLKDPKDPTSKLVAPAANHFDEFALHVYEGGTVFGQMLLDDRPGGLAWHAATKTGFGGVKDDDGNLSVRDDVKLFAEGGAGYEAQGANAGKHYAVAQRKLLAAVRASKKFPGMTIWTAHPTEAPDKTEGGASGQFGQITGKKIIGPDFGGKAMASLIGKEFGNMLHFDSVTKTDKEKDETSGKNITTLAREFRIYTRRHHDPNQQVLTEYLAGNRCALPDMMDDYYVSKEPGDAILQFYEVMTKAVQAAKEKK